MVDEHMYGEKNEDAIPTASQAGFQKTNPLGADRSLADHAEHVEIRKAVYTEIKKLHSIVTFVSEHEIVEKFLNCVTPMKHLYDPGRLPVFATRTVSPENSKLYCIWTTASCLVQAYWNYERGDEDKSLVLVLLAKLNEINTHYKEMKVVGAENTGYWLEI